VTDRPTRVTGAPKDRMVERLPDRSDFPGPPAPSDLLRWEEADMAARPVRLGRVRTRLVEHGLDAYFGVRPEHMRYLTGFRLADGEEKVAGHSGKFIVGLDDVVVLSDTRYTVQAVREAPGARVAPITYDLPARWGELLASVGARRVGVEAGHVSHGLWTALQTAAPGVDLVRVDGWVEADRATKEPAEVERIRAAAAVADRALAAALPEIRPGVTEEALAWRLEIVMRTSGAEALAFAVACLAGPEAALPHGSPGERPVLDGAVLLFDFGAQVAGYRSDMTRTLFVGEPRPRDVELYGVVAAARQAAIDLVAARVADGAALPTGREADAAARDVIVAAGHGDHFGHGTGHGIGLATHELPSLSRQAAETPLPSPTVFSVEPGIYLEGEMGVRIEDLVHLDAERGIVELLTGFPRGILVLG